jgi:hypothetical protein
MILNNKFLGYDMSLVELRNKYLIEASLLNEDTAANNQWYVKWKGEAVVLLKNNFTQFRNYANSQIQKYNGWLRDNRQFFDTTKYPVDKSCAITKAPDYKAGMMRIKEPIINALNGLNLQRIEVQNDTDGTPNDNRWFMKTLIKTYNGDGTDFNKYAKSYYYGEDKKEDLTPQDINAMMGQMYQYCMNYMQTVHMLENQMQSIITYLNRDPVTGQQQTSNSAETQLNDLNRANQTNQNNQVASTNPNNNVVQHASADYLLMRECVFLLSEYTAPNIQSAGSVSNTMMASTSNTPNVSPSVRTASANNKTYNQDHPISKAEQNQQNKKPNGTPKVQVNDKLLIMKKKQVACDIVKDCFSAKVTATGFLYRDFITLLQTHVATLKQNMIQKNYKAKQIAK